MTPEQITRNLYSWLMAASRIEGLPMGSRPCTWEQLVALDPGLADQWRAGVGLFLGAIGAKDDDDEHLNFVGSIILDLEPAPVAALYEDPPPDPAADPPPVRPDD